MKDPQDKNHSLLDRESDPIVARSKLFFGAFLTRALTVDCGRGLPWVIL